MKSSSLIHKHLTPQRTSPGKCPALILLHGRGANEDDLLGLAEYLDERFFIIAPRAPFSFPYGGGYTWYEILELGKPEPKGFAESFSKLQQFLEEIKAAYPIDPAKIILGGFSMGSILSLSLILSNPTVVAGVAAHSGYIPENAGLEFRWKDVQRKRIFLAHGIYDPVIPIELARRAKELLTNAHTDLTYREFDIGHQISEDSLEELRKWLEKRIDAFPR